MAVADVPAVADPRRQTAAPVALVVTGANGYLGAAVAAAARRVGMTVRALVRTPAALEPAPGVSAHAYALDRPPPEDALAGAAAVVHLAADLANATGADGDPNLVGLVALREAARRAGISRFIFVSSQSAAPDAISGYGRSKWRAESLLRGDDTAVVLRPGLVCGGAPRGLYGVLAAVAERLPVIPMIRPDAPLHPIHVDELAEVIVWLATAATVPPSPIHLGTDRPVRFDDFLRCLGRERRGGAPLILPLPTALVLAAVSLAGRLLPPLRFLDDRLRGIAKLAPMPVTASSRRLPRRIRPRSAGPRGAAGATLRRLLAEAQALLAAVRGGRPNGWEARQIVRALPPDAASLGLPALFVRWHRLGRLLATVQVRTDLQERIRLVRRAGGQADAQAR